MALQVHGAVVDEHEQLVAQVLVVELVALAEHALEDAAQREDHLLHRHGLGGAVARHLHDVPDRLHGDAHEVGAEVGHLADREHQVLEQSELRELHRHRPVQRAVAHRLDRRDQRLLRVLLRRQERDERVRHVALRHGPQVAVALLVQAQHGRALVPVDQLVLLVRLALLHRPHPVRRELRHHVRRRPRHHVRVERPHPHPRARGGGLERLVHHHRPARARAAHAQQRGQRVEEKR